MLSLHVEVTKQLLKIASIALVSDKCGARLAF